MAQDHFGKHDLGEFVAVLWEIWNARNRCLFGSADRDVTKLGDKAISFVWLYREACDRLDVKDRQLLDKWIPPPSGMFKINFDGAKLGALGHGWGFVVRNGDG